LQKRVLKNVVGEVPVAQVTLQVAEQLFLVPFDENTERFRLTQAKLGQQLFIRTFGQRVELHV
jgi:hypothetical protein